MCILPPVGPVLMVPGVGVEVIIICIGGSVIFSLQ